MLIEERLGRAGLGVVAGGFAGLGAVAAPVSVVIRAGPGATAECLPIHGERADSPAGRCRASGLDAKSVLPMVTSEYGSS